MNIGGERRALPEPASLPVMDRWILHRVSDVTRQLETALEEYRFDVAADLLYHFFWHEYADWYIEFAKPRLASDSPYRSDASAILVEVHDRILRLLHPMMPFVTEELWQKLPREAGSPATIAHAPFPAVEAGWEDDGAVAAVELLQEVVTTIRTVRAERGVPPSRRIEVIVQGAGERRRRILDEHREYVARIAGLEELRYAADVPRDADTVTRVVRDLQIHIPLKGIVDREAEKARIRKDLAGVEKQRAGLMAKLSNPMFRERADGEIVKETETLVETLEQHQEKLERILQELGG
jgi:valyl-tRNA synthetase